MAMWIDTLIDGSIFREWVVNVGRRDGRARLAHLLCEFARRLEVAGLTEEYRYELPMTQEQLADATGLTPVHVNRVLMQLAREGLIERNRRFVGIPDWEALRRAAGFSRNLSPPRSGRPASPRRPDVGRVRRDRFARDRDFRKIDQALRRKRACANRRARSTGRPGT